MKDLKKIVGLNIRNYRVAMGLSQEELAYRASIHRALIGHIERGERNITLKTLYKIAIALMISPVMLLDEKTSTKASSK